MNFNLIDDDWIPCLRRVGEKPQLMSLRQTLLQAHVLREIYADSPLTTAAIYRLCIAVLHSIFRGPQNPKEWHKLWKNQNWRPEDIEPYLNEYSSRFNLFGENAFWQTHDPKLTKDEDAMFMVMGVDMNMGTLFDHRVKSKPKQLTLVEAAQALVTIQVFALGGGQSEKAVGENRTDAPWARGIVLLAEGKNLFETLTLNLIRYPPDPEVFPHQSKHDEPLWKRGDVFRSESESIQGYLDYLTWPSRRVLLLPPENTERGLCVTKARVAQGRKLPKEIRDFMKGERRIPKPKKDQPPYTPIAFDPERALWRDSSTLLDWRNNRRDQNVRRPYLLEWLAELANPLGNAYLDPACRLILIAFGMATEKANIVFTRVERLPLPVTLLHNGELVGKLSEGLNMADSAGKALHRALRELAAGLLTSDNEARRNTEKRESVQAMKRIQKTEGADEGNRKSDEKFDKMVNSWGVEGIYWDALELPFGNFINSLADAGNNDELYAATAEWQSCVRNAAVEALERAEDYAGENARALRAAVAARGQLFGWFKQHLPKFPSTLEETKNE